MFSHYFGENPSLRQVLSLCTKGEQRQPKQQQSEKLSDHQQQRGTLKNHCQNVASADPPNQVLPQRDRRCNRHRSKRQVSKSVTVRNESWVSLLFCLNEVQILP